MKKKKILSLLLAVVMTVGVMGCGAEEIVDVTEPEQKETTDTSEEVKEETEEAVEALPFEETIVLNAAKMDSFAFYGENDDWVDPENNLWLTTVKERLNVEFQYEWISNEYESYGTKWNLAVANGSVPTVAGVDRNTYEMLYEAGMIADMSDALEKYGSEDLKNFIYGSVEEGYMTRDGVLYGVPNVRASMDNYDVLVIRKDWMEKIGVEEVPNTIEGILELGRQFVDAGLGKYAIAASGVSGGTGWAGLQGFFQGYGVPWASGYWNLNDETGELYYGMTDDAMSDALLELQSLYAEGLIKEDYVVSGSGESINNGETGIIYSVCFGPVFSVDLFNLDPEADLIAVDIPTVTGDAPTYYVNAMPSSFVFVSAEASEVEKRAVIEVINLTQELFSDMDSDVDWGYHREASPLYPANQYESSFQYAAYYEEIEHAFTTGDTDSFITANGKTYYNRVMDYLAGDTTLAKYYPIYRVPGGTYNVNNIAYNEGRVLSNYYSAPLTESMKENTSMLDELLTNAANNVIMGADISVWTDAVEEWYATGGQEMTDDANEWYKANK